MASAGGNCTDTSSTSPEHTEAVSHMPIFHMSTSTNCPQSGLGMLSARLAVSKGQPVTVVPVNAPVAQMRAMTPKGARRKNIIALDPCPTESIPARLSTVIMTMNPPLIAHLISSAKSACIVWLTYVKNSPGYSAVSTAEQQNCSQPAIPPAVSPKAALAQSTNPPFSGYIVLSSAVISARGTAKTTPSTMMPMKVARGPPVLTSVSVPSGPPATEKYIIPIKLNFPSVLTLCAALVFTPLPPSSEPSLIRGVSAMSPKLSNSGSRRMPRPSSEAPAT
mmetsp:Transcript_7894/g.18221  ORF Transcript_7894/g.18221 Transcript_7894/m.18221 type:complete len:278 (+) Transcript_7894:805-1638(+)